MISGRTSIGAIGQRGFTLIELSAVTVIAGLLMIVAADGFRIYNQKQKLSLNYEKFQKIDETMSLFYAKMGRYPCPADPTLPMSSPDAGKEMFDSVAGTCTPGPDPDDGTIPPSSNVIRTFSNTRLTKANTGASPTDMIAIGGVPYKTLLRAFREDKNVSPSALLSKQDTVDTWGYQITYAVTESMAVKSVSPADGAIYVRSESNGGVAGTTLTNPAGSAHLVLLSHGDDNAGAFNVNGVMNKPCAAAGTSMDAENCNNDGIFISGLRNMAAGNSYFDDQMYFRSVALTAIWAPVNDPSTGRPDIYNLNEGGVGIGTGTVNPPRANLEVKGTVNATTSNGKDGNANASLLCGPLGTDCFDTTFFTGDSNTLAGHNNTCPPGQVMSAISNATPSDPSTYHVACITPDPVMGFNPIVCDPGEAISSFVDKGDHRWSATCIKVD